MSDEHFPMSHEEQPIGVHLHERIQYWSEFFESASDEEMVRSKDDALNELDGLLDAAGFLSEDCIFSAEAVWTDVARHVDQTDDPSELDVSYRVYERRGYMQGCEGHALGFATMEDRDGTTGLWLAFKGNTMKEPLHPTLVSSMETLVYAKADTLTALMRMDAIEEAFEKQGDSYESIEDQLQIINLYSEEMNRMLRSSNFRRMRREDQATAIDELIERAESESDIVEKYITLNPGMAYRSELGSDGVIEYTSYDLQGFTLDGLCLALCMPGRELLHEKGIRRNTDMISKYIGLAFMMESEGDIYDGDQIVIPSGTILNVPVPLGGVITGEVTGNSNDTGLYDQVNDES